jgi:hypothetical protein
MKKTYTGLLAVALTAMTFSAGFAMKCKQCGNKKSVVKKNVVKKISERSNPVDDSLWKMIDGALNHPMQAEECWVTNLETNKALRDFESTLAGKVIKQFFYNIQRNAKQIKAEQNKKGPKIANTLLKEAHDKFVNAYMKSKMPKQKRLITKEEVEKVLSGELPNTALHIDRILAASKEKKETVKQLSNPVYNFWGNQSVGSLSDGQPKSNDRLEAGNNESAGRPLSDGQPESNDEDYFSDDE